jgi:hypothetical protein
VRRWRPRPWRAVVAALCGAALAGAVQLTAPAAPAAEAATVPSTATVSADALPTVQVNGVVWAQVIAGGRVYATGEFTSARPAGAAAGQNEVARANLLAYDLATGQLVTSFSPALNGPGYALAASSDGSRLYVAGSFTSAGGRAVNRVAAVSTATGAVDASFRPRFDARVRALALNGGVLYAGGIFSSVGGTPRSRLAAVDATSGALLPWAPTTDAEVMAAVVTPGTSQLVVAGRFSRLNGVQRLGSGALDLSSGSTRSWAVADTANAWGPKAAVYSLATDGTTVYATGYNFGGSGNLEGSYAATADGGRLVWASGCRGDTYAGAVGGGVFYSVGHAHDCAMNGGNPETSPRSYQHAKAFSAGWKGARNSYGVYAGQPGPDYLHWLPTLAPGTYTGQSQAAWSVATDGRYVVLGGEFPSVNGTAQQGLVRFVARSAAPQRQGPQGVSSTTLTATPASGAVQLSWKAAWDRDDASLTYEVLRGPASAPVVVATTTAASSWWDRPALSVSVPATASATYRVRVKDPSGNTATGPATTAAPSASGARTAQLAPEGAPAETGAPGGGGAPTAVAPTPAVTTAAPTPAAATPTTGAPSTATAAPTAAVEPPAAAAPETQGTQP